MDAEDGLLLRALLERGDAFRELAGDRGSTPLHIAAERGKEIVVNYLLLQEPPGEHPDLLQKDHEGDTPLHIAAGNFKIFKLMFPANPDISGVRNSKEQTLLHYAAGKNCPKVVDFLLKVNGGLKFAKDYTGATPFHFGARSGSLRYVMDKLMNTVDETNYDGLTALHYAARNGHTKVVLWLLGKGASVSTVDLKKRNTALHWAAINQSPESSKAICAVLIEKADDAADVLSLPNVDGKLPVDLAHDFSNEAVKIIFKAMIKSLVLEKFDHMARQDNGTLLHYAAAYGTEEDVELVLKQILFRTARNKDGKEKNFKLNVNKVDSKGQNAFHWAARVGNTNVIQVLKSNNVNPLLEDANSITPLCRAIICENVKFAEILLGELENLSAQSWMNVVHIWIDQVEYVFDQQIHQQIEREIGNANPQLLRNLIEKAVLAELPTMYKALCAGKKEIAKVTQKESKGVFEFVKKIESSNDLVADVVDVHDKTPLDSSDNLVADSSDVVDGLHRDPQVYLAVLSAILAGAALIVGCYICPILQRFWIFNYLVAFFLCCYCALEFARHSSRHRVAAGPKAVPPQQDTVAFRWVQHRDFLADTVAFRWWVHLNKAVHEAFLHLLETPHMSPARTRGTSSR